MHAARGNADFRAHPELAAIGKLGRGVDHDDGAVDLAQEAFGAVRVLGDDAVGMVRAIGRDMRRRLVETLDDADRNDAVQIFGAPVFLVRRCRARDQFATCRIAAYRAAGLAQRRPDSREDAVRNLAIDENGLAAPQIPVRRILALTASSTALPASASESI